MDIILDSNQSKHELQTTIKRSYSDVDTILIHHHLKKILHFLLDTAADYAQSTEGLITDHDQNVALPLYQNISDLYNKIINANQNPVKATWMIALFSNLTRHLESLPVTDPYSKQLKKEGLSLVDLCHKDYLVDVACDTFWTQTT